MALWSALFRLALCLTLALNPATAAVATTHTQHDHGDREAMTAPQADASMVVAEDMPCHHHQQAGADSHEAQAAASQPATGKSKPSAPDCCNSGGCHCMQHAQPAISMVTFAPTRIARADIVRKESPGHASPVLPHLIRPPIG
jgi:hypothetical protein